MDDLIRRHFLGSLSDVEAERLRVWCRSNPEHEARFQEFARLWQLTGADGARGRARPTGSLAAVLTEAGQRRERAEPTAGRALRRLGSIAAVAAAALTLLLGGWLLGRRVTPAPMLAAAEFSTGERETVTVTLNDGSFVRLAPKSRLAVTPAPGTRNVWLEGRAYFAVAKDPDRPFRVLTRAGNATALGTRFEAHVDQEDLRLAVVEGRVALVAGGNQVEVGAGEVSQTRKGAPPSVIRVADIYAMLDWPRGLLVFQATPLIQVAEELERHFRIQVRLASPALADRMVTAWFEEEKLEVVLTTICRVTQTSCSLRGDTVTLAP